MPKRAATFALVMCLSILAIALVLGITRPEILGTILEAVGNLSGRVAIFFRHIFDGARAAAAPM